ncbi:MAG: hypothetical protein S4CHLAM20_11090 [Chlamydiia bacterium]|nr:hypothetical protein [Chlamydiia bacterium]
MFIRVKIKPNNRINKIEKMEGDFLCIKVKSPREKGLANKDLIATLSLSFNIPKSAISIKSGLTSPNKMIEIDDTYASLVFDKLTEFS